MKNLNKIAIVVSVVALVVAAGVYFQSPQINVDDLASKVKMMFGAQPGPAFTGPVVSFNGVNQWDYSSAFNKASSTICSFKTPAATSTLVFGSAQIRTATSSTISFEIGKSTVMDATTTRLAYDSSIAAVQETLTVFVASTTAVYGALGQQHTADEQDTVFAPNTYFNVKYGSPYVTTTLTDNGMRGSCKATFIEN